MENIKFYKLNLYVNSLFLIMSEVRPARANVTLCANCGIALRAGATTMLNCGGTSTVLNLSEEVKYLLQEWIERKVLDTDKICKNCEYALNQSVEDKDRKRKVPHSKICVGCGKSVLRDTTRNKTYKPDDPIAIAVLSWHPLLPPKEEIYVCRACNRHLERKIAKQNNETHEKIKHTENESRYKKIKNESSNDDEFANSEQMFITDDELIPNNDTEYKKDNDRASRLIKRHEMLLQQECLTEAPAPVVQSEKLILQNYKRLPSNAKQCIFKKCTPKEFRRVPKHVKEALLIEHKIYASNKARICTYHIHNGDWKMLLENKLYNDFSAADVEDALEILKKPRENPVDFEDVEGMSNNLCQFLTGMTTKDFVNLHDSVTWNFSQSRKALAVLLMKVRSKDPFEKIASLLGLSRETATRYFTLASESLEQADCDRMKIITNPAEENGSDEENCKSDDE